MKERNYLFSLYYLFSSALSATFLVCLFWLLSNHFVMDLLGVLAISLIILTFTAFILSMRFAIAQVRFMDNGVLLRAPLWKKSWPIGPNNLKLLLTEKNSAFLTARIVESGRVSRSIGAIIRGLVTVFGNSFLYQNRELGQVDHLVLYLKRLPKGEHQRIILPPLSGINRKTYQKCLQTIAERKISLKISKKLRPRLQF